MNVGVMKDYKLRDLRASHNYGYIVLVHTTRRILIGFSLLEIPKVAKPVILEGTPGIATLRTFLGRHVASKRSYRTAKGSIWPFFQRLRCQLYTRVRPTRNYGLRKLTAIRPSKVRRQTQSTTSRGASEPAGRSADSSY